MSSADCVLIVRIRVAFAAALFSIQRTGLVYRPVDMYCGWLKYSMSCIVTTVGTVDLIGPRVAGEWMRSAPARSAARVTANNSPHAQMKRFSPVM